MAFYTNVVQHKNKILVAEYSNNKRSYSQINYKPYLFVPSKNATKYRTINNESVEKIEFDSIYEAKEFYRKYEDVDGFNIYGLNQFAYTYIYDTYKNMKYDVSLIRTAILDIEVDTTEKYPTIEDADNEITAITILYNDIIFALGYGNYISNDEKVKYIKCKNEHELLHKFIKIMSSDVYRPDVISGWNVELFDIPYCIHRICKVLGDDFAKKLSPFSILEQKTISSHGKDHVVYTPLGVNVLDYLQLYKKFTYTQQESYKLDHISYVELDERKLDYSDYENLADLYHKNHQLFMEYNIKDCILVKKLDDKMKLLELVYTFAYDSGVNYSDALTTVRTWDVTIHNYLLDRMIVVPKNEKSVVDRIPAGAYVKDSQVGMYDWIVSFDLASLYPSLIMGYNISPDTFRGKSDRLYSTDDLLAGKANEIRDYCLENKYSFAANSCFYTQEFKGFLPALMEELFNKRKQYKAKMLDLKKEYEKTHNPDLKNEISKYENLQMAAKIKLNSAYGALANSYFRWFDLKYAESITLSGQLTIRWAEKHINDYMNTLLKTENKDYVIIVDTDSLYINMNPIVEKFKTTDKAKIIKMLDTFCEKQIQPFLDKIYIELSEYMNCYAQKLFMKREGISERGICIAKKRYILNVWNNEGIQYEKPKLKMMGIEAVRSSTPESCRDAIKDCIQVILNQAESDVIRFIDDFRLKFQTLSFEEIAFPRGLNGLDKYSDSVTLYKSGTPIHVRGAILYNKLIRDMGLSQKYSEIYNKEKIKFCYLKIPNPIKENVIACPVVLPKQFGLDKYLDYDLQFEKAFLEPIKTILDAIGWQTEKRNTIRGFFK